MTATIYPKGMTRSAELSKCQKFRYELRRVWDVGGKLIAYCGLNPSTADAALDDPTVRKWVGFARRLGFGGFVAVNMFAYRATKPTELRKRVLGGFDAVGLENDAYILRAAREAADFVVCWGIHGGLGGRDQEMRKLLADAGIAAQCFGFTSDGQPKHPLMLSYSTRLEPWRNAA